MCTMEVRRCYSILLVLAVAVASPIEDRFRESDRSLRIGISNTATANHETTDRSLRIGSNNAATTDHEPSQPAYSVSFVPLFSLLANFIPKILSRFSGVNQPAAKGRSFTEIEAESQNQLKINSNICSMSRFGQWNDVSNCHRFYTCNINSDAPSYCQEETTPKDEKEISTGNQLASRIQFSKDQQIGNPLKVEVYSNPCVVMTVYECPSNSLYSQELDQCIPKNKVNSSRLCEQSSDRN